jgi:hypothetical protein
MRRSLLPALVFTLAATTLAGAAMAATPAPQPIPIPYPTDRCVASKLSAAATTCRQIFDALAFQEIAPIPAILDRKLAAIKTALGQAFSKAEDQSLAAGVDCKDTTDTSDALFAHIRDGATGVGAQIRSAVGGAKFLTRLRSYGGLQAAGWGCGLLVEAESNHLVIRSHDRERKRLGFEQGFATVWTEILLRWSALGTDNAKQVVASIKNLANEIIHANTVSPNVSTDFAMISPPAEVQYQGKTLTPICSRGTPWVYFVRRGTVNKLLVYYQGGGACWDYATCEAIRTFKDSAGPSDNPANARSGLADMTNPQNPFKDWSVVFVPYCTGDVHWGDAIVEHKLGDAASVTIRHKGFVNAQVAEKFAREHFVDPEEVFVTGSSAGAYGAIMNGVYLEEGVYPSSNFSVLGDAGNGVVPRSFVENQISKWGIENNLPKWIPALNKPVTELDAAVLWAEAAKFYPHHRFANYSTAYDGGQGGQTGFFKVMSVPENPLKWADWWTVSCPWHDGMKTQVLGASSLAPENYRYYIGTGSRHTMWGSNKVYTDTTGGVPTIVSWVNAMRGGTSDWTNVECTDCGLLLAGDPRPPASTPPAQALPYTPEGRIVCEAPPTP